MAEQGNREGQQLGNYRLERLLGRGAFAEVYLGQHIHVKSLQAAIKVLHTRLGQNHQTGFLQEAETIARLRHPHIIRILDFGIESKEDVPYLIMEYAPNGIVRNRHPSGSLVPLATVAAYVKQIASALQYAHDRNLVHRDLKPENLLVGESGEILLSDFGIASIAHSTSSLDTGIYAGTVPYSAPEQIIGKPRRESDQYALGIMVYEWLSGKRPFQGTMQEIIFQHLAAPSPPLGEKGGAIAPGVEEVVMKALAKDPHRRFASVQDLAVAFEQAYTLSSYPRLLAEKPVPSQPRSVEAVPVSVADQPPLQTPVVAPQSKLRIGTIFGTILRIIFYFIGVLIAGICFGGALDHSMTGPGLGVALMVWILSIPVLVFVMGRHKQVHLSRKQRISFVLIASCVALVGIVIASTQSNLASNAPTVAISIEYAIGFIYGLSCCVLALW